MDRFYLSDQDPIRTICENRVRRSFWAAYILLATVGAAFIVGSLWRVG